MAQGKINVSVENIFPLIKKFLYSDHEIFLRELISNATDATLKLKHLTAIGEAKVDYGNPQIEIKIDKKEKKITITDQGLGRRIGNYQQRKSRFLKVTGFCGSNAPQKTRVPFSYVKTTY